ncbi:MAG: hypothetical protein AAGA65_27495 [Actinomycetota bacterium]
MAVAIRLTPLDDTYVRQEIVDSIVGAVDLNRSAEIERVRLALETIGLDVAFQSELRLTGVPSVCDGECWFEPAEESGQ